MKLNEQIIKARKANGHTQESLAKSTNLSLRTIQRIEKGEGSPRTHTIKVLSNFLDIELLSREVRSYNNSPNEHNTILLITYTTIICSFVPLLNLCPPLFLWLKNQNKQRINNFGKKVVHFQVTWLTLFLFSIFLIPPISLVCFGQVEIGNSHVFQVTYMLFVIANIITTVWLYNHATQAHNSSANPPLPQKA